MKGPLAFSLGTRGLAIKYTYSFALARRLENSRSDEGQLRFLVYTLEMGSRLADLKGAQPALAVLPGHAQTFCRSSIMLAA